MQQGDRCPPHPEEKAGLPGTSLPPALRRPLRPRSAPYCPSGAAPASASSPPSPSQADRHPHPAQVNAQVLERRQATGDRQEQREAPLAKQWGRASALWRGPAQCLGGCAHLGPLSCDCGQ